MLIQNKVMLSAQLFWIWNDRGWKIYGALREGFIELIRKITVYRQKQPSRANWAIVTLIILGK